MSAPAIRITGEVDTATQIDAATMASLPGIAADAGAVAEGAIGEAVRVDALLRESIPTRAATHCTVIADEGSYRASIPLDDLRAGGWLAFGLDGGPLPADKGGPFRLTVASGSTLCWNVKRVVELKVTTGPEPDDVPENPPH